MHYGRILALVGVVVGAIGFVLTSATSAGDAVLPALSQADPAFPSGFDNTWTALYNDTAWAAIVFALAGLTSLAIAFIPPIDESMKRLYGLTATVLGILMLLIGIFATLGAGDRGDTLQAGFAQAAQAGLIPEAYTVSIGFGWYLWSIAGALVAIGGIVSLIARPDESAIETDEA